MKKRELLYERSFNVEFYEGLCTGILRSHSFHSMRERTHENRGSSQEIENNQVFHEQDMGNKCSFPSFLFLLELGYFHKYAYQTNRSLHANFTDTEL